MTVILEKCDILWKIIIFIKKILVIIITREYKKIDKLLIILEKSNILWKIIAFIKMCYIFEKEC